MQQAGHPELPFLSLPGSETSQDKEQVSSASHMAGQAPGSANSRSGESEHRSTQGRAGHGHATASPAFCLLFFIPLPRAPAQAWSSEALGAKRAPWLTWRNSSEGRDMPTVTHTQENATAKKTPASCPAGPASMPDRPAAFPFLIPL